GAAAADTRRQREDADPAPPGAGAGRDRLPQGLPRSASARGILADRLRGDPGAGHGDAQRVGPDAPRADRGAIARPNGKKPRRRETPMPGWDLCLPLIAECVWQLHQLHAARGCFDEQAIPAWLEANHGADLDRTCAVHGIARSPQMLAAPQL